MARRYLCGYYGTAGFFQRLRIGTRQVRSCDPQKVLDYVGRRAPLLLGYHSPTDSKRLTTFNRTIQARYVTATRNAAGVQIADTDFHHTPGGSASSKFGGGVSAVLVHVLVIGDANKVAGDSIGSIADYISMLILSYAPSLDDCDELLYHTDLELSGFLERSHIHAQMQQQLLGH